MPHSRAGAITLIAGSMARADTSMRTWSLPLPVQPCAMAAAFSMCAISTSFFAISGRLERRGERIPLFVQRVGLQRGQDVVARKLLAHVQHVASDGAGRHRALANLVELAPLPEIERRRR